MRRNKNYNRILIMTIASLCIIVISSCDSAFDKEINTRLESGDIVTWTSNREIESNDCIRILFKRICHSVTFYISYKGEVTDILENEIHVAVSDAEIKDPARVSIAYTIYRDGVQESLQGEVGSSKNMSLSKYLNTHLWAMHKNGKLNKGAVGLAIQLYEVTNKISAIDTVAHILNDYGLCTDALYVYENVKLTKKYLKSHNKMKENCNVEQERRLEKYIYRPQQFATN